VLQYKVGNGEVPLVHACMHASSPHVYAPQVHVSSPQVHVSSPQVHVSSPQVHASSHWLQFLWGVWRMLALAVDVPAVLA